MSGCNHCTDLQQIGGRLRRLSGCNSQKMTIKFNLKQFQIVASSTGKVVQLPVLGHRLYRLQSERERNDGSNTKILNKASDIHAFKRYSIIPEFP
jgi:hypothetical protein